jgi:hypothetical protein
MVREPLQQHLYKVKALHERDLATGTYYRDLGEMKLY